MKKAKLLLKLFSEFFKIGLFTFGGGYAMISIIEDTCVEKHNWISHDEMMNVTVIAESTPGPIAINCSTYVGYKQAGIIGALTATLGMVMPSFVIIYIISLFLKNFLEIKVIAAAFSGIKVAVGILILNAAYTMIKKMKKSVKSYAFLIFGTLAMLAVNIFSLNISSIYLILVAAAASLAIALTGGDGK